MKVLIIIPAYNEETSLPGVLRDLREQMPSADILVVNDGSRDGTARVAREHGVAKLSLPFNLGIGAAMQAGYLYALRRGYDAAVQFDGDGQHVAMEIGKLLAPIRSGSADLVVGSRFLEPGGYRVPFMRRLGIRIFAVILTRILNTRVTDTTSGFRAAGRNALEFFARAYPEDYPEVESLVLLHKLNRRIVEVPVTMRDRTGGTSSITFWRSAYYMVKVMLAVFIDLLKTVK